MGASADEGVCHGAGSRLNPSGNKNTAARREKFCPLLVVEEEERRRSQLQGSRLSFKSASSSFPPLCLPHLPFQWSSKVEAELEEDLCFPSAPSSRRCRRGRTRSQSRSAEFLPAPPALSTCPTQLDEVELQRTPPLSVSVGAGLDTTSFQCFSGGWSQCPPSRVSLWVRSDSSPPSSVSVRAGPDAPPTSISVEVGPDISPPPSSVSVGTGCDGPHLCNILVGVSHSNTPDICSCEGVQVDASHHSGERVQEDVYHHSCDRVQEDASYLSSHVTSTSFSASGGACSVLRG